jgi:hypothetical protein
MEDFMKKHGKLMYLILILAFILISTSICAESYEDVINNACIYKQEVIDTPLEITYDCETITYHHKICAKKPPPGCTGNMRKCISSSEGECYYSDISVEYFLENNVRYSVGTIKIVFIKAKNKYRIEKWEEGEDEPRTVEVFDGNEYKVFKRKIDRKKVERKEGKVYESRLPLKMMRFKPSSVWPGKFIKTKTLSDFEELQNGDLKYYRESENGSFQRIFSPDNNYMMKLQDRVMNELSRRCLKVSDTVKVGSLILPADVKKEIYTGEKLLPSTLEHFTNFKYRILSEEEVDALCNYKFPEGTEVEKVTGRDTKSLNKDKPGKSGKYYNSTRKVSP